MTENYIEEKPKTFKFGQVGDYMKGTLIGVSKTTSPDPFGKLSNIYSVKAKEGTFFGSTKNEKTGKYVQDKEPTVIEEGEQYSIFISLDRGVVIEKMKSIKLGQKFMIKFDELKPTTKGNDLKVIKVFPAKDDHGAPVMDKEWVEAQGQSLDGF